MKYRIIFLALVAFYAKSAQSSSKGNDPQSMFIALLEEGKHVQAEALLAKLEGDATLLAYFQAYLAQARGNFSHAENILFDAYQEAPDNTHIKYQLTHIYLLKGKTREARALLDSFSKTEKSNIHHTQLQARALSALEPQKGLSIVATALKNTLLSSDEKMMLHKIAINTLTQIGLEHAALEYFIKIEPVLQKELLHDQNFIMQLGSLRSSKLILTLEGFALQWPDNPDIFKALGYASAQRGLTRRAAAVFMQAHALGNDSAFESADQLRLLERHHEALSFNAQVQNRGRQLEQRIEILLNAKQYQRALALFETLEELGLMNDKSRYRQAYALASLERFSETRTLYRRIQDPKYRIQVQALLHRR